MSEWLRKLTTVKYNGETTEKQETHRIIKKEQVCGETRLYIDSFRYVPVSGLGRSWQETASLDGETVTHVWNYHHPLASDRLLQIDP